MTDPLTVAVLASAAAQEGIKFLYGQLSELLKRSREKRSASLANEKLSTQEKTESSDVLISTPPIDKFAQIPRQLFLPIQGIQGSEHIIEKLLSEVNEYLIHITDNRALPESNLKAINDLREIIESLSKEPIAFIGEHHNQRPIVDINVKIKQVSGHLVIADVKSGTGKDYIEVVDLETITPEGNVIVHRET